MDWYEVTGKYHEQTFAHDFRLQSLPEEWQRELASLWRLEADVNNGAYIQFLVNWGKESYLYASQALKKIGARKMARIIDTCQALVDEHFDLHARPPDEQQQMIPNPVVDLNFNLIKEAGSVLPNEVVDRINQLSYEFMDYPEDVAGLGLRFYRENIERGTAGSANR